MVKENIADTVLVELSDDYVCLVEFTAGDNLCKTL